MPLRGRNSLTGERYYFITTTVVRFLNVFEDNAVCDILIDNLKYYQNKYHFNILGYVIMPSHFHWIVEVNPEFGTVSDIMRDIKRRTSKEITLYLSDREEYRNIFKEEAEGKPKQQKKFWMDSFDDRVVRDMKMFWEKLNYIHNNPLEAGLVRRQVDYKYSSARNYAFEDHSLIYVDIKQAGVYLR